MDFEGRSRIHSHLDIAPLIDIVFLLLVFFMLTSTFMTPEAIELNLPESSTASAIDATPIIVSLSQDEKLMLNGEPVRLDNLKSALAPLLEKKPDQAVTLKSDGRTQVQQLISVMDQIRAAGTGNISLATVPEI